MIVVRAGDIHLIIGGGGLTHALVIGREVSWVEAVEPVVDEGWGAAGPVVTAEMEVHEDAEIVARLCQELRARRVVGPAAILPTVIDIMLPAIGAVMEE